MCFYAKDLFWREVSFETFETPQTVFLIFSSFVNYLRFGEISTNKPSPLDNITLHSLADNLENISTQLGTF